MSQTIFGKILSGVIPCHKVYEDERVFAFLDINPLTAGHTLVVPKEPAETLDALSDESAAALGRVLPRICRAVIAVTGVKEYNVLENNGAGAHQTVAHVHFHIIPKPSHGEGLGLGWAAAARWTRKPDPSSAAKLRAALGEHRNTRDRPGSGCYPPVRLVECAALLVRGGAVWQLVGLITRRSQVQILPPLP